MLHNADGGGAVRQLRGGWGSNFQKKRYLTLEWPLTSLLYQVSREVLHPDPSILSDRDNGAG